MPRPVNPNAPTPAERARAWRYTRQVRTVQLPAETMAELATVRARDGDASDAAALRRLVREAAAR